MKAPERGTVVSYSVKRGFGFVRPAAAVCRDVGQQPDVV